jgi:hypothetical protein
MTRGVVLRQEPFFIFFVKPRGPAASKSPQRHWNPHGEPSSFAILNQRPADFPGKAADWPDYETLIDLPEQAPKVVDTDATRGDLKPAGLNPDHPAKIKPDAKIPYSKKLYACAIGSSA